MDHIILSVHNTFGGDKVQPDPPMSYNKKPGYLRKAFKQHGTLAPHLDSLNILLDEANQIAEFRKWCAHGVMGIDPDADGKFEIVKICWTMDAAKAAKKYTPESIEFVSQRALALSINLCLFGAFELGIFPKDQINDALSRLSRKD